MVGRWGSRVVLRWHFEIIVGQFRVVEFDAVISTRGRSRLEWQLAPQNRQVEFFEFNVVGVVRRFEVICAVLMLRFFDGCASLVAKTVWLCL